MSDQHATPRRAPERRVRLLLDRALSASAGIVALSALTVSAYQAWLMRDQQHKSVWPYVMQYNGFTTSDYTRAVRNAGLGPARVRLFEVLVDGKVQRTWPAVMRALVGRADSSLTYGSLGPGSVLLPGQEYVVLTLHRGPLTSAFYVAVNADRMRTLVCYCSLYDECWLSDSAADEPQPVRACIPDARRQFQN